MIQLVAVNLTENHLDGVLLAVDNVNDALREVGGVSGYVVSVVGPAVVLVDLHSHVVTVTGQVLPDGGLVVLDTVAGVGSVVPSDQVVSDDIGLIGSECGDGEATQQHGCDHDQGQDAFHGVHWRILSFSFLPLSDLGSIRQSAVSSYYIR